MFVCDNTAFVADHVIRRKHTLKAKRELPGLLAGIVGPLKEARSAQQQQMSRYQATPLTVEAADHAILQMYRRNVIGARNLDEVMGEWETALDHTAWVLFNAATRVLTGKVIERPRLTSDLHEIIDAACEPCIRRRKANALPIGHQQREEPHRPEE